MENVLAHVENGEDQRVQRDVENGEGHRLHRMPHVHADWLSEPEKVQRDKDAIHREVKEKLTTERAQGCGRDKNSPTETRSQISPLLQRETVNSDDEEDLAADEDECAATPRRGPKRACKHTSSYKIWLG